MKKSIKYIALLTLGITIGTSNLNSIFYATNANQISSFTSQPIPGVTIVDETNNILARSKVGGGMEIVE